MTKKLFIILPLFALIFTSCGTRGSNAVQAENISDCIDGVVINGVRWATRNVDMPGTFAENPEDAGMLYQWNRSYGWRSTPHYTDNERNLMRWSTQRWNPTIGTNGGWEDVDWDASIPTGTAWYAENDPCPEGWRVPNFAEIELLRRVGVWATLNGVYGNLVGTAPHQIFLPAAGFRRGCVGSLSDVGEWGYFWSSTTQDNRRENAWRVGFGNGDVLVLNNWRGHGFSVRCVAIE